MMNVLISFISTLKNNRGKYSLVLIATTSERFQEKTFDMYREILESWTLSRRVANVKRARNTSRNNRNYEIKSSPVQQATVCLVGIYCFVI